jgi:hypothetical protein
MIRVFIVITCCTLTSAAIHTFSNNRNQYYRRNDLDSYYRRNDLETYQHGGYFNYGGFLDNLSPDPVCGRTLTKFDCPLFDFRSNLVSKDDYLNAVSHLFHLLKEKMCFYLEYEMSSNLTAKLLKMTRPVLL